MNNRSSSNVLCSPPVLTVLISCGLLVFGSTVFGQDPSHTTQQMRPPGSSSGYRPPSNTPVVLFSSDEDYRIGISDVIEIRIEDAPELSGTFRVATRGTIPMPFLGNIVAQNKTTEELSKLIANGLRGQYLKNPSVSIAVLQYNSRSFFIQGAVQQPGVYQIEGRPSLLKLITIAGGLAADHGSTAFIIREIKDKESISGTDSDGTQKNQPKSHDKSNLSAAANVSQSTDTSAEASPGVNATSSGPGADSSQKADSGGDAASVPGQAVPDQARYEMLSVNINSILKGNFAQNNTAIAPGDIINIPPTDVFFVAGEVRQPGSYPLKEGTTLRQAISLAQGTTFKAKSSKGVIFREDQLTGKRQEISVNIGAVMSGKEPDIPIKANDVVIVPNSRWKSVGSTVLTAFGVNSARVPFY